MAKANIAGLMEMLHHLQVDIRATSLLFTHYDPPDKPSYSRLTGTIPLDLCRPVLYETLRDFLYPDGLDDGEIADQIRHCIIIDVNQFIMEWYTEEPY